MQQGAWTHPAEVLQERRGGRGDCSVQALNHGHYCVWHLGGITTLVLPTRQLQRQHLLCLSGHDRETKNGQEPHTKHQASVRMKLIQ